jgi:hypothetical protein
MPGDPNECRQHARTCAHLAQTAATPEERQSFANLTNMWLRLASELESTLALVKRFQVKERDEAVPAE